MHRCPLGLPGSPGPRCAPSCPALGGVPLGVYRSNHHPKRCHRLFAGHGAPSASASPGMASCSNRPGQECGMSSLGCPQLCHPPGGPRCPPLCQVTLACDRACQGCAWDRQPHCSGFLAQRGAAPRYGVPPHLRGSWGLRTQWRAAGLTYCKTTPCSRAPTRLCTTAGLRFSPAAWHAGQGQRTSPHARCCVTATGGIWI